MSKIEEKQDSYFGIYLDTWYLIDSFSRIWYLFGSYLVSIFAKSIYLIKRGLKTINCYLPPS